MGIFEITEQDMARDRVLEPDWYEWTIKDVTDKPAKDGSNNTIVTFEGAGENNKFITVPMYYNEKAGWAVKPLLKALMSDEDLTAGKYKLDSASVGKRVQGFCKPDLWEGTSRNKLTDFRAV